MLEVSGCLRNEKETSVGEIGEMYDSTKCMWWVKEKKWKVWACQQVSKKYKCLQKKKEKCINTIKIWSWYCARKKKKEVEKNKSEKNTWV